MTPVYHASFTGGARYKAYKYIPPCCCIITTLPGQFIVSVSSDDIDTNNADIPTTKTLSQTTYD